MLDMRTQNRTIYEIRDILLEDQKNLESTFKGFAKSVSLVKGNKKREIQKNFSSFGNNIVLNM